MLIIKTEILGSNIEINCESSEKNKVEELIENFKQRLSEFESLHGKVSDKKLMFLAALKAEDHAINVSSVVEKININDEIKDLKNENKDLQDTNHKAQSELNNIEKKLDNLIKKILAQEDDQKK